MANLFVKSIVAGTTSEHSIEVPNECPICHTRIRPLIVYASRDDKLHNIDSVLISCVLSCPECHELFYTKNIKYPKIDSCSLVSSGPVVPEKKIFEEEITNTSPNFVEIFNQSKAAEAYNLNQIAGVGYRKSLEFLIKDYSCKKNPNEADAIKKTNLAKCISTYINQTEIVATALAATWLGNDETHYIRVWDEMDISNLKSFIEACVYWIIMEGRASIARAMINREKTSE